MNLVIAIDSFKESLNALELCRMIKSVWNEHIPSAKIQSIPLADGGEGSLEVIAQAIPGNRKYINVYDPLLRPIESCFLSHGNEAYIEMARASGIELTPAAERTILQRSSFGTGQLIKFAIMLGHQKIHLFLGGSATHDLGLGMAEALGYRFYTNGKIIRPVKPLHFLEIDSIQKEQAGAFLKDIQCTVYPDVKNTLLGVQGAAQVYAPQKGASAEEVEYLEKSGKHIVELININPDFAGAGAAGGLGFGAKYFLDASICQGMDFFVEISGLEEQIKNADMVITGEGKIDDQSLSGKVVSAVGRIAKRYHKSCVGICAVEELKTIKKEDLGLAKVYPLFHESQKNIDIAETISRLKATIGQMALEWKN